MAGLQPYILKRRRRRARLGILAYLPFERVCLQRAAWTSHRIGEHAMISAAPMHGADVSAAINETLGRSTSHCISGDTARISAARKHRRLHRSDPGGLSIAASARQTRFKR